MAPKIDSSSISEGNNMIIPSIPTPPRPIIHTIFGYLNCLNLRSIGLEFSDIPYSFGLELVVYVGTIPCPIPSEADVGSSGLQDQLLETQKPSLKISNPVLLRHSQKQLKEQGMYSLMTCSLI